jgi:hypothetical protein
MPLCSVSWLGCAWFWKAWSNLSFMSEDNFIIRIYVRQNKILPYALVVRVIYTYIAVLAARNTRRQTQSSTLYNGQFRAVFFRAWGAAHPSGRGVLLLWGCTQEVVGKLLIIINFWKLKYIILITEKRAFLPQFSILRAEEIDSFEMSVYKCIYQTRRPHIQEFYHLDTYLHHKISQIFRILEILLSYGAESFLRSCQFCSHLRTSQHFMELEGSSPCSQEPSVGPYF